jgi:hypothetical protein
MKFRILLALTFFCFNANAAFLDEIQVYDGEINEPGEFGLELHINTTVRGNSTPEFEGQRTSQSGTRLTPEFTYGLSKTVELGFYLPTIYTPGYGYELAGYKPRLKWLPIQADEQSPWSFGVNFEYSDLKWGMELPRKALESRFIIGWENSHWSLAFNPILSVALSDGQDRTPNFYYGARSIYKLDSSLSGVGLEYYQGVGPINSFPVNNSQAKQLFAIFETKAERGFMNNFDVHFGVGYGWDSADTFTLKLILTPKLK